MIRGLSRSILVTSLISLSALAGTHEHCAIDALEIPAHEATLPAEEFHEWVDARWYGKNYGDRVLPEESMKKTVEAMSTEEKNRTQLIFIGDSIAAAWREENNISDFNKHFSQYNPQNFAIGADTTHGVLRRIQEGNLDGFSPEVVVILIGVNNIAWGPQHTVEQTADGILKVVQTIHKKMPETKILLTGLLPRGDNEHEGSFRWQKGIEVNAILESNIDDDHLFYLNIAEQLIEEDGTVKDDVFEDGVHLSSVGLNVWAEALRPSLEKLIDIDNTLAAPLDSDGHPMIDLVAVGKAAFLSHGCFECHAATTGDGQNKTGPSLFGLLQSTPVLQDVIEADGNRVVQIEVNRDYILSSVRESTNHLALKEGNGGVAYLPIMPSYSLEILSDSDLEAIVAYLETLNVEANQGPLRKWAPKPAPPYVLSEDQYAVWVKDRVRLQRVDVGEKHSGRAYHVGLPGDINYNFDPRNLAVVDIWSGSFLTVRNEQKGRAGLPSQYGYNATIWPTQNNLFQPLYKDGSPVDFSFKEPAHVDEDLGAILIADKSDYVATVKAYKACFSGVKTPRRDLPSFAYQVDGNEIELRFEAFTDGRIEAHFSLSLGREQNFIIPTAILSDIEVSDGFVGDGIWSVPAGQYEDAVFAARVNESPDPNIVDEGIPAESLAAQKLRWIEPPKNADLLPGYTLSDGVSPLDRFGREQLFEPLGMSFLNENVAFISTRTAGIWKIVNGEWFLFAEGVFESLGLIAESEQRVLIGEKPGLTLLIDDDGDHWAESRQNISDQFRFTGNYHSYLHGPVKRGDSYFYNLNLAHNLPGVYKAGGLYMGTAGGLRGWLIEIDGDGEFSPFASGFRSPAGLSISPSNDIIYTENQGEFVSTSKIFKVEKDRFYGNPTGLIDLPGMNYLSEEVRWDAVKNTRALPILLLPHERAMNSPGSPVWDNTNGRFGPFAGQMLVGDQTQSNIFRVFTERVKGIDQGVLLPFADGLSSGVVRLAFNPADNSLWVGETGRGWAAKGGSLNALQRISWDGTKPDAIHSVKVTPTGFEIIFTKPQQAESFGPIELNSWYYRDSPDYGSPELGTREEIIFEERWSTDAMRVAIDVQDFAAPPTVDTNTARVYYIDLTGTAFGETHSKFHSRAYYTLHAVPNTD